ncbi:hypothetical protein L1987_15632 [Smallanthus sonchifolius]|uniref:Uncharacterized protein n=1 Tax=Smallanthus sonchifolius TaxID=185202 RepID=A0ACB9J652_9ASTR|nr:hypothetical protein L1987_15632 [Smallanthus sonchifolius]
MEVASEVHPEDASENPENSGVQVPENPQFVAPIRYWKKVYSEPLIQASKRKLTHVIREEYLPKDGGDLGGDSRVLACI